jgi:hypothetical protein
MTTVPRDVNTWQQLSILPSQVIEVTYKLGYVRETRHLQVQVETVDKHDGSQLSLWSIHHADQRDVWRVHQLALDELVMRLQDHIDPF